ncbi:MAG: hypothetical protein KF905_16530 [Flavobacteriales bacterium]|nr:hypothetical protein [Flavobacteriales bacterium]
MEKESSRTTDPRLWCQGFSEDGLDVRFLRGHGLVLIDRLPAIEGDAVQWLRQRIKGPGGAHATVVDGPHTHLLNGLLPNETLLHTVHGGLDGPAAVVVDQYLLLRDAMPALLVRLITPVNGRKILDKDMHDDLLIHLLGRSTPNGTTINTA